MDLTELLTKAVKLSLSEMIKILEDDDANAEAKIQAVDTILNSYLVDQLDSGES